MSYYEQKNEVKTEYSLIKHLNILCSQDEKYKDLYAAWTLDKEVYSKALSAIIMNFPHYSMHDSSHSASIINKIEMLLGEERIKSLSPTDTFMILESAYLHDFGMIVANSELLDVWGTSKFQRYLKSLKESIYDKDIVESAEFLLKIQDDRTLDLNNKLNWPVRVRNAVTIIAAEYFRKRHNIRSANWIEDPQKLGIDINFNKLIPDRIIRMIGKVSVSHGTNFEDMFYELEKEGNGIGTDKAHPRLIGSLLRIGDLLDLDNGRFNEVTKNSGKFPESSELHKKKHASITHFLVCPKRIEVSAVCEDENVYRVTREWFDSLKEELKNLSSRWAEIVPDNFQGGPPSLGEIKLSIKGAEKITEQLNLEFSIDQKRAFELIEGSGIYDTELVFIRELLQNSLDASKMQMWKDIKSGKYDYIGYTDKRIGEKAEKNEIFFYSDIPQVIRDFYPINIEISYKEPDENKSEDDGEYIFEIEDRGCGISINDLKRMENVGGSWRQEDQLADFIEGMPDCLKPTGSFGMGIHSVFMITDKMNINTKSEDDKAYKISFVSRRKNGYIAVKENLERKNVGTEIILVIKESKMKQAISNLNLNDRSNEFKKYDCFSSRYEVDDTIRDLAVYIDKYICNIKIFKINCSIDKKNIESFKINKEKHSNENEKQMEKTYSFDEKKLSFNIYFDKKGILKIQVKDKNISLIVSFSACMPIFMDDDFCYISGDDTCGGIEAFFKEIKCNDIMDEMGYFDVELNIYQGEAKSVLDVARNNLKKVVENRYLERLKYIFKESLNVIKNYYIEDIYDKDENKKIKQKINNNIESGNKYYELSMLMFRLAYNKYFKELLENWGDTVIIDYCYKINNSNEKKDFKSSITFKDFMSEEIFIICTSFYNDEELLASAERFKINGTILSNNFTFEYTYIFENFKIVEYREDKGYEFIVLKKDKKEESKCFIVNKESVDYKSILAKLIMDKYIRSVMYPIKYNVNKNEYCDFECLVVNKEPKMPYMNLNLISYNKYFIISPFVNIDANEYLKKDINSLMEWLRKKANFDELVKFVVNNSVQNKDKKIEEGSDEYIQKIKKVEEAYKVLIQDYLDVQKEIEEENTKENQQVEEVAYDENNDKKDD